MAVDLSSIHRLTNLSDINRFSHEVTAKERAVDGELDQLLSKRTDLENRFLLLKAPITENLEVVRADCEQLLGSAKSTAELADHISGKVRRLDLAQTRVNEVLESINLILDRTACINGVQAAMDSEDYEVAARHIFTFMDLEAKLSAGGHDAAAIAGLDAGQAESQRQVLLEAKERLEAVVDQRFDEAVAQRDAASATRFARLYKPLGKKNEGLRRFIQYIQMMAAGQARQNYAMIAEQLDSGKRIDWSAALSLLFKDLALTLESHEALVAETFGQEALLELLAGLQSECDTSGGRLIARFIEVQKLPAVVREASGKRGRGGQEGGVDHRGVEAHITQLIGLCRLTEEYNQFILGKMRNAADGALSIAKETSFRSGGLNVGLRELLGHYMALEEVYMEETANMAISIDELIPGSLTSSMVDDVFFIFRKCALRALTTSSVQVISAMLMELNNVLANSLRNALSSKLSSGPAPLMAAVPLDGDDAASPGVLSKAAAGGIGGTSMANLPPAAVAYVTALNNSDVAAEYVTKLKAELEGYLTELFPSSPTGAGDRERVRTVLADLGRTAGDLRQGHIKSLEALADALMPRLRPVMDEMATASYALSEAEYSAGEFGDGWASRLLVVLEATLLWMQPLLTTNNYEGVLHSVLDKVVARLETLLARKAFNQLGGLQLDRDIRALVGHLSELTSRTVRDKFARLNQMALVLGLETVEELADYWGGDSTITWRLSAAEVRSTLAQRTDFSREAIKALPLH
uniref:Conserved oligomeric Golgi complex subunit 4 n=1 Tax=Dunaliella tertiolecta TaxID=3047 RepID=A0A7S3RBF0_DUNTE|mmetsp:Transcript_12729/g.34701  ORF Transcript_12729/g.34701 Transcript_12729/m.34701 type:complete len:753 (+) Transcript_12729:83-2341(+)